MIPDPESLVEQLTKEEIEELLDGDTNATPPSDPDDEVLPF